jgi:hypothetical protein
VPVAGVVQVMLLLECEVSGYRARTCSNHLQGLGLKPTGRGFGFDFKAGGADDGGVLDRFSEEDEVEGTLVGCCGLCQGVVNGN